jgi:ABC-type uncharacterized transport system involved in gliding motility auxiliary subunit
VSLWEKFRKRTVIYGGTSALAVLLVAGILIFIVLLGNSYSLRWDLTRYQSNSLSAVSRTLLKEVNKPLTMTVFLPEGHPERQQAREVLELYARRNPHIRIRFLDPIRNPVRADEAGYRRPGNVLLEYEGREQLAETAQEEPLTEALRKVLQKERKKIYFLTGHGERSGSQEHRGFKVAEKALETEGYEVADLNLLKEGEVPKGAAVVIIPAPKKDLLPNEVEALKGYLTQGGRVFILLEPFKDGGLKTFLAGYGINLDNGIIFELNQLTVDRAILSPIVTEYNPHRITENFSLITLFPGPRPLFLNKELKTVTLQPLVTTSGSSWEKLGQEWKKEGKKETQALYNPKQDKKGPFTLAAVAELEPQSVRKPEKAEHNPVKTEQEKTAPPKSGAKEQAYLAVFGDADFAADEFFNQLGNGDLFLNTVNFLASEEQQILIRKPEKKFEPLLVTGWTNMLIFLISVVLLPLAMLTFGVAAYMRRRARR